MAAKRYSAGAIFLQVVPVFANVQNAIESETKNIDRALGDQMEKSGQKAGERAGKAASKSMNEELRKGSGQFQNDFEQNVGHIQKALDGIDTSKLNNNLRRDLANIKRELRDITSEPIKGDSDFRSVHADLFVLEQRLRGIRDGSKIVLRADIDQALKGFAKIEAAKAAVEDPIDIEVRTEKAERQMGTFERAFKRTIKRASESLVKEMDPRISALRKRLDSLQDLNIGVDISSNMARLELTKIGAELGALSKMSPEIDVKVDAGKAWAEIVALEATLNKLDRDVTVDVDVNTGKLRSATNDMHHLVSSGEDAANTFRSFNGILLAAVSIGPALIPILSAIAGGLLAIGPASAVAAFGLGSVLIGFSGIGDALSALQARDDQMATTVEQSARTQESSAQRVADARRSAARSIESALDQQRAAQERYAASIQDVKDAEQALQEARDAAKGTGADINRQIQGNQLDIDQALIDSFNATTNFNAVMADGSSTNLDKEQARIDREEALLRLKELRAEQRDLAKEKKKWDEEGLKGVESVKSAQDQLNSAIGAQQDAYEALGKAAKAVDQARADGARQVAEAMRAQSAAMEDVSAQQRNLDAAMGKLGPIGRRFALFLYALKDDFYGFRDDIQKAMLPSVQNAIESFFDSKSGSALRDLMITLASGFGKFVEALSKSFQGPVWLEFFETLNEIAPQIMRAYGKAFITFLEAFASILTTLAPYSIMFAEGFAGMADSFNKWAQSKAGQKAITDFMDYVVKVTPDVIDFFWSLGGAILNLLIALAPYAEMTLNTLTDVLNFIANMDTDILGPIAAAILALLTGSQVAYGVISLLLSGGALLASTVGSVIFGIVALGLAIAYLMHTNEGFRDFMIDAWERLSTAVFDAWNDYLFPALKDLGDAIIELWYEVLEPFFSWIAPIIVDLAEFYFPKLLRWWGIIARGIAWLIREVLIPWLRMIGPVVKWLVENIVIPQLQFMWDFIGKAFNGIKWIWENILEPVFDAIGEEWDLLMSGMRWAWNNILKPIFDFISDTALPKLQGAFETTIDAIATVWEGLKKVVGAPIKFVLDTIINQGLIDGFNQVADWVGMDGFDHIPIPKALQSYATGGIMPGYTPNRDVHSFISPTGGRLELSGGEAVMRPEWTAAVGPGYVNYANDLARSGGVSAIRRELGGAYSLGGILPGASISPHSNYGHYAADLNWGSGYDDYGRPIHAYAKGFARSFDYGYDNSYGRGVVIDHGTFQTLYAHMSAIAASAIGKMVNEGTTIGYVGDYGNTGNPPTSHLHFEIGSSWNLPWTSSPGSSDGNYGDPGASGGGHRSIPGFIKDVVLHPIDTIKGWASSTWGKASDFVNDSPIFDYVKHVPEGLASGIRDAVMTHIPGWVQNTLGIAGKAGNLIKDGAGAVVGGIADAGSSVGDALGLYRGGILPYNGTLKYDAGGYLPPGLTTVMNLTGKPEPVFTNDQWGNIDSERSSDGFHYEPHFDGSDLTAADVNEDLEFQVRKMRRQGGRYKATR